MSSTSLPQHDAVASTRLFRAVWRWHFYAGFIVVPLLITLSVTGLIPKPFKEAGFQDPST